MLEHSSPGGAFEIDRTTGWTGWRGGHRIPRHEFPISIIPAEDSPLPLADLADPNGQRHGDDLCGTVHRSGKEIELEPVLNQAFPWNDPTCDLAKSAAANCALKISTPRLERFPKAAAGAPPFRARPPGSNRGPPLPEAGGD